MIFTYISCVDVKIQIIKMKRKFVNSICILALVISISCVENSKKTEQATDIKDVETITKNQNGEPDNTIFKESGGFVLFEAESIPLSKGWSIEDTHQGFSGDGYITWTDSTNVEKNNQGLLPYKINITKPGIYTLKMRNFHDCEDFTECNDVYVKMNDGEWQKNFNHNVNSWDWTSQQDIEHVFSDSQFDLDTGMHTLYLSGRSKDFSIDRIALYHEDTNDDAYQSAENSEIIP